MNKRIFVDFDGVILDTMTKFEELKDPNITWDDFFLYFDWRFIFTRRITFNLEKRIY